MLCILIFFLEFQGYFDYYKRPSDYIYTYTKYKSDLYEIKSLYSVNIGFSIEESQYPEDWKDTETDKSDITSLKDEVRRAKVFRSLSDSIILYPKSIFSRNIEKIYILDKLFIGGTNVSGTYDYSNKNIYIATNQRSNKIVEKTLHHEFSSILINKYTLSEKQWRNAARKNFQYEQDKDPFYAWLYSIGEVDHIDQETLLNRGLLRQYAETGVENDFNIYAEYVFSYPSKMKKLISEYPIIKRKYEVFKDFYLSIDEGFQPVFDRIDS